MGLQKMTASLLFFLVLVLALGVGLTVVAPDAAARPPSQSTAGSGLGRPYWHVFMAYVIAWALVLGWVVSIARRLARIEKRLED